jgi:hypothetical protein
MEIFRNQMKKLMKHTDFPENQEWIAQQVVRAFADRRIVNYMVLAKTQSGKTGSMCATIKEFFQHEDLRVPKDNIFIITGLSSCDWKDQTIARIPDCLKDNIFHRNELSKTFVDKIAGKKNVLVIMDEVQVAAKQKQTICTTFAEAGMNNKAFLYQHDIKIIEFTATPNGTLYDLMKWGDASAKLVAGAGEGYTSAFDLLERGKLRQYKPLHGDEAMPTIHEIANDVGNFDHPMYHFIRTPVWKDGHDLQQDTIDNFRRVFGDGCSFQKYDRKNSAGTEDDINETLNHAPSTHTFIFIKEKLRCAKTLTKKYIGVMYERYTNSVDDSTIIQGLVGRLTGYDYNGMSVCYTNLESILRYERLWKSGFDDTSLEWRSGTTRISNGELSSIDTFNTLEDSDGSENEAPILDRYRVYAEEEVAQKVCHILYGKHFRLGKQNENGFYLTSPNHEKAKVYSVQEAVKVVHKCFGLKGKRGKRLCLPCYVNTSDNNSIRFVVIVHPDVDQAKLLDCDNKFPM